jgi:C-terminal processing protease CtpA/Prc
MRVRLAVVRGIHHGFVAVSLILGASTFALADAPKSIDSRSNRHTAAVSDVGILGFHFAKSEKHVPEVVAVFADTPAAKEDLRKGDSIINVNGVEAKGLDKEKIYKLLSGKPDTKVILKVDRGGKTLTKILIRMHSAEFARAHPEIWKLYVSSM